MIRRLPTAVSLLSLLVCVLLIGLWLSGYARGWRGMWEGKDRDLGGHSEWGIEISGGGVCLSEYAVRVAPDEKEFAATYRAARFYPPEHSWRHMLHNDYPNQWGSGDSRWVFKWKTTLERPYLVARRTIIFPGWLLLVPTAVSTVGLIVSLRKRRVAGYCSQCGYDLRASAGRCPECGATTPMEAKA